MVIGLGSLKRIHVSSVILARRVLGWVGITDPEEHQIMIIDHM